MLSLSNAFKKEDLANFEKKIFNYLNDETKFNYSAEPKIDGISASLTYKNGNLILGVSRGDGTEGELITDNLRTIKDIHKNLEEEFKSDLPIGVCHPGVHSPQTGLVKNAPNCLWLEKKPFQNDLRKALGKEVFCENDANCFALSEAIDGSGKHYKIVYGIILGSGVGGGLVIDKKIVSGPNGVAGEWGHNQIPYFAAKKENFDSNNAREAEIESFISGLGMAKRFNKIYKKNLKTNEIFELNRRHDLDAERFIDDFKLNLAMSLSSIINILDPDAFIFGGGVSNEIDFLNDIDHMVKKFVIGKEYEGVFLKPRYGDASGVRGAARLGRSTTY